MRRLQGLTALIALMLAAVAAAGAQAATLSGTITSQDEGGPFVALQDATVAVSDPGGGPVVGSARTDALGGYAVVVPDGTYDVEISAAGYEPLQRSAIDLDSDRQLDETLVATGHARVHGVVREADGRPIPDVAVSVGSDPVTAVATTGAADGRFSLAAPQSVTATPLRIQDSADAPSWMFDADGVVLTGERELDLSVPARHELTVRVLGDGDVPVPGAQVATPRLHRSVDAGGGVTGSIASLDASGYTDGTGAFRAPALEGGVGRGWISRISVWPPDGSGYEMTRVDVPEIGGPTEVVVRLEPNLRTVAGTLRDSDGSPVAGAEIRLAGEIKTLTATDGSFSLEVAPGVQSLEVFNAEETYAISSVDVAWDRTIELTLPARVELTVRVLGDGGRPVAGAIVDMPAYNRTGASLGPGFTARVGSFGHTATTDAAGEVRFAPYAGARSGSWGGGGIRVTPPEGSGYTRPANTPVPPLDADVSVEVGLVRPDTAPAISFQTVPEAVNGNWWSVSRVAVHVTASDANIGTLACSVDGVARSFAQTRTATEITGTFYVNQEGRHTAACTAVDRRGNVGSASRAVDIDLGRPAAPTATADRAPDSSNGWYRDSVTVSFADNGDPPLADGTAGSGVDPATVPAPQTYDSSGTFVAAGTVADRAGRVSTAGRLTVKVDADPPTSTLTCPTTPVRLGATANASWQDADGQSGLAGGARGSVALDTSAIGVHVAEHTAVDRVGHRAGSDCQYTVVYAFVWRGGLEPAPALNAVAPGVTSLTVRFSIAGDHGLGVMSSGWPRVQPVTCAGATPIGGPVPATVAPLSYDTATGRYAIAWDVGADLPAGTCAALRVRLVDGVERELLFAR